ncbi:MAG: hypothetical protein PUB20_03615 [Clostridia bacterium]|nr:hypothetical protein [Clostridia bacterium]
MEDLLIKLPKYNWFDGLMMFGGAGNIYTGSIGTDPKRGAVDANCFRYRVWLEKDENGEKSLIAAWYRGLECYAATDDEKINKKEFEGSQKGILQAQEWLLDSYNKGL